MEYVLIVSFAVWIGFCLGVLVMVLLESSEAAGSAGRVPLRVRDARPARR